MTISKGSAYGEPERPLEPGGPVAGNDRELADFVTEARRSGAELGRIGLSGGDLHRTLGGREGSDPHRPVAVEYPVDLGVALIDGKHRYFVAHLVVRRRAWHGPFLVIANAQWLGSWDIGPKSHPGDAKLDSTAGELSLSDRFKARSRLPAGSHVPHPALRTRRFAAEQFDLDERATIYLDSVAVGSGSTLSVRVEPDALRVVV